MERSAFEAAAEHALDAIYSQQGVAATYTPSGGSGTAVTVLVEDRSRRNSDKQGSRSRVHTLRGSVRVSEVEVLGRGDTITLDQDNIEFRIVPSSVMNDGLEWEFEATADVVTTLGDVRTMPDQ